MKKLSVVLLAVCLILSTAGLASATLFVDFQPIYESFSGINSFHYQHNTPSNFEVPYDTVNSATILLTHSWVDGNNDTLTAETEVVGVLTGSWLWSFTGFDVADVFVSWTSGDKLDMKLAYTETGWRNSLKLNSSTFTLDYTNGAAPVPEPGTMLLLGAGLLGLAGYGRRKFNK